MSLFLLFVIPALLYINLFLLFAMIRAESKKGHSTFFLPTSKPILSTVAVDKS